MTVNVCRHGYEVGHCPTCNPLLSTPLPDSCGPTHHLACDCREAKVARLVEAMEFIRSYSHDTIYGPTNGLERDRTWYRSAVAVLGRKASAALDDWKKP